MFNLKCPKNVALIQVEEEYLKQTHAQRQEAAQARRDERKRLEKEKIQEMDPEVCSTFLF